MSDNNKFPPMGEGMPPMGAPGGTPGGAPGGAPGMPPMGEGMPPMAPGDVPDGMPVGGMGPTGPSMGKRRTITKDTPWKVPMDPIGDDKIVKTYEADVVVVGHGYGGITACRELAEQGFKVVLLESQPEESYRPMGNAMGTINSTFTRERGVKDIDPIDFFNNWMINSAYTCNQTLIMKFAQNSGSTMDWYMSECTEEDKATMHIQYFPRNETIRPNMLDNVGVYKFWSSSVDCYGRCGQTQIHKYNRDLCKKLGAEFVFGAHACQLVQGEDKAVTGVIAEMADGTYIKATGKSVVLATGGFGGNKEMCQDLLPDVAAFRNDRDPAMFSMADYDGSGIQMAYWAGGKLDPWPIPTMNGKMYNPSIPQGIWLDKNGFRYCNEFVGPLELRGRAALTMNRDKFYVLYDSNLPRNLEFTPPGHTAVDPIPEKIDQLKEAMNKALHPESAQEKPRMFGPPGVQMNLIGAETLEELVDKFDCSDKVKANILASVERYNKLCETGRDEDFGRDPEVMYPIKDGPFFAEEIKDAKISRFMCTLGGLVVDGEQRVLGDGYDPIPGLFATGALTSGKFGLDYYTPIFGASLGINITLGRECGRSVAKYLRGELDFE